MISFGILLTMAYSSAITSEIDKMIDQIQKRRVGIDMKELASTPDPFVVVKKDVDVTKVIIPQRREENFTLGGIVNHKASINGKWYKEGDDVGGYILNYVGTKGVVLVDQARIKRIFLHDKIEGIITIKEGM